MAGRTLAPESEPRFGVAPAGDGAPAPLRESAAPESPVEAYFLRMEERFRAAAAAVGGQAVRTVELADARIRIRLAGPALAPVVLPALAHLEVPEPASAVDTVAGAGDPPPDLTVLAFDSASTGIAPPPPPSGLEADGDGGPGSGGPVIRVLQRGAGLFSMFHPGRRLATVWTQDAARVPWNEVAAPLRMILQPWLASRGWQLVHAAAVGTPEGGVLIGGRSGAGKSTTALACVGAGLGYAGDDYVLATVAPEPTIQSVYASAKLLAEQLPRFPAFAGALANPVREPDEKPVLLLAETLRERLLRRMPLRAVVVPRVTGTARPAARPIPAAEALAALAPSTLFQLPLDRPGALARLRSLVEACPCFVLEVGPDLPAVAAAVRGVLEGFLAEAAAP